MFKGVTDKNKLHHRFMQFYDKFEGDSVACLALHNIYVMARLVAEERASKLKTFAKILTSCSEQGLNLFLLSLSNTLSQLSVHKST